MVSPCRIALGLALSLFVCAAAEAAELSEVPTSEAGPPKDVTPAAGGSPEACREGGRPSHPLWGCSALAVEAGGGAAWALGEPSSGHLAWVRAGADLGAIEVAGVLAVAYPGGGVQARVPLVGLDARVHLLALGGAVSLHAAVLAGWAVADAAEGRSVTLGGDPGGPRWNTRGALVLAPGLGVRWDPAMDAPSSSPVHLVLELRPFNLSHVGLVAGAGLSL